MATIERRVTYLEGAHAECAGPLVLSVPDGKPTTEQLRQICEAERASRAVVLVGRLDALL